MPREDRRVVMTKRLLKEALIEKLKEKDIYHISVRELCETADINRSTFYKHYGSQFDLLADMENDLLDYVTEEIRRNESDPVRIISAACRYLEDNLEFVRLIINNNVDPAFAQKLFAMDSIRESSRNRFAGALSEAELDYLQSFLTNGVFSMVSVWLKKEDRETPDEFAEFVGKLIPHE